ncbi:MAG: NAD(+)/NADH kinase [bacterium]
MTTVGIIYKKEDRLIEGTAQQVIKELKKHGYKVNLAKAKLVITLGGDGTILRAARMLAGKKVPILGVHMGGVGFLTEVELHKLAEALGAIKQGKYQIDERMMIEATVGGSPRTPSGDTGEAGRKMIALNDIVISKSGIARVIKLEVEGINEYTSDGIIFSTATGSTAYNLSAGGPILTPNSGNMVISVICPHTISDRPIVMHGPVTVQLNRGSKVIVTADGQQMLPLLEGQKVRIEKSKLKTRFIRLKGYDFFARVKEAFAFGPEN